jgi:hypothetical protein
MKKLALLAVLALLACQNAPNTPEPKDVLDVMPADNEISGWTRSQPLRVAENETQLYALIDGAAPPFINNGFVKCAFQTFNGPVSGNGVDLEVQLFDQTDSTKARTLYPLVATGTETPWTGDHAGVEARIDEALFGAYRIDLWQDKFYASITIQDKSTAGLDVAKLFAFNVANAIKDTTN